VCEYQLKYRRITFHYGYNSLSQGIIFERVEISKKGWTRVDDVRSGWPSNCNLCWAHRWAYPGQPKNQYCWNFIWNEQHSWIYIVEEWPKTNRKYFILLESEDMWIVYSSRCKAGRLRGKVIYTFILSQNVIKFPLISFTYLHSYKKFYSTKRAFV